MKLLVLTFDTKEYEKAEVSKNCYGKIQLNKFPSFVFDTWKVVTTIKIGKQKISNIHENMDACEEGMSGRGYFGQQRNN